MINYFMPRGNQDTLKKLMSQSSKQQTGPLAERRKLN